FAGKDLGLEQIHQADAAPADLVLIAGADAAAGSTDLIVAALGLTGDVDPLVIGHDDVQRFGQQQTGIILDAARILEFGDLLDEHLGIKHHSIADNAALAFVQDAGGDQVQYDLFAANHKGMTGVIAPLIAHDIIGVFRVD